MDPFESTLSCDREYGIIADSHMTRTVHLGARRRLKNLWPNLEVGIFNKPRRREMSL